MRRNRGEVGMRGRSAREQQRYNEWALRSFRNRKRNKLIRNFAAFLVIGIGIGVGIYFAPQVQDVYRSITGTATVTEGNSIIEPINNPTQVVTPSTPKIADNPAANPTTTEPIRSTPLIPTRLPVYQIFAMYDEGKITADEAIALLPKNNNSADSVSTVDSPEIAPSAFPTREPSHTPSPRSGNDPEFSSERVYVGRAYIVGAKWNPIILRDNPHAKNPTWSQLKSFLQDDPTDKRTYDYSSFVCADFAEMLHNNAEHSGIRAAYVSVELGPAPSRPNSAGHALVAFQTIDRGLVFIDSTAPLQGGSEADKSVDLREGFDYIPESVFPEAGWLSTWGNMGEVLEIETVQW